MDYSERRYGIIAMLYELLNGYNTRWYNIRLLNY